MIFSSVAGAGQETPRGTKPGENTQDSKPSKEGHKQLQKVALYYPAILPTQLWLQPVYSGRVNHMSTACGVFTT